MCEHKWVKKKYNGLSVVAEWEVCKKCGIERNRKIK